MYGIEMGQRLVALCDRCDCVGIYHASIFAYNAADGFKHFASPDLQLWVFITSYLGIIPAANCLGFAGQELARKLPTVFGVLLETTLGSIVEMVLFVVLIVNQKEAGVPVVRAAILGSILANLLLCLGLCFFVGGLQRQQQTFHDAISDTGSNLMLVAGSEYIEASPSAMCID